MLCIFYATMTTNKSTGHIKNMHRSLITYRPHQIKRIAASLVIPDSVNAYLNSLYKREPRFPSQAIFKFLLLFFISDFKHLHAFWKWAYEEIDFLTSLGFDVNYYRLPSYKSFWHFWVIRIGTAKIQELFYITLDAVKSEIQDSLGIEIGREAILDATPVEAKSRDQEASYNGHYKKCCYLWTRLICANTGIPLGFDVISGSAHEGHIGPAIVYRAYLHGVHIRELWVDDKFAFSSAIATYWLLGIDTHYRISASWKGTSKATWQKLYTLYQRMWHIDDFKVDAGYSDVLRFLIMHGYLEEVGSHLRSLKIDEWNEAPDTFRETVAVRNLIETDNGYVKRHSGLKGREFRGRAHMLLQVAFYELGRLILVYSRVH